MLNPRGNGFVRIDSHDRVNGDGHIIDVMHKAPEQLPRFLRIWFHGKGDSIHVERIDRVSPSGKFLGAGAKDLAVFEAIDLALIGATHKFEGGSIYVPHSDS